MSIYFTCDVKPDILRPREEGEVFISNKKDPKISIISISFNHGRFIEDNILSIARQTYKNFEHIIIDNQSTDETKDIVAKYPHVTFISEKDSGVFEAFIKGVSYSKGEYILMSTATDGLLNEQWLEKCLNVFESEPDVSLVWGISQSIDESSILQNSASHPIFWDENYPNYCEFPEKEKWFDYWKQSKVWFCELNMITKRNVFIECYIPSALQALDFKKSDILGFHLNFNRKKLFPYFIKEIANFGRTHSDSISKKLEDSNQINNLLSDYFDEADKIN
jgi:glycosyltransferase involved in cell wall biosynthesis